MLLLYVVRWHTLCSEVPQFHNVIMSTFCEWGHWSWLDLLAYKVSRKSLGVGSSAPLLYLKMQLCFSQLWAKFKLVTIVMMLVHHYLLLEAISPIKISLSFSSWESLQYFIHVFPNQLGQGYEELPKDSPCLLFALCASYVELDGQGRYQITFSCRTATSRQLLKSVDTNWYH